MTHPDVIAEFPNDEAAIEHAEKIARELAHNSIIASGKSRVTVRDKAGKEIGHAPLLNIIR